MKSHNISLIFFLILLFSCNEAKVPLQTTTPEPQAVSTAKEIVRFVELELPSGESLKTQLAITMEEQTQGLSGIQDKDFADT